MKLLTIDFEAHDPYISRKLGAGWVYHIREEIFNSDFEVLGAAMRTHDGKESYETDWEVVRDTVMAHDGLIMHNAQYDIGCLLAIGIDCSGMLLYDTLIMSKLYRSSMVSHSLDNCGHSYLGIRKNANVLEEACIEHDLFPWTKKELAHKAKHEAQHILKFGAYVREPNQTKLKKFAINNVKAIQEVAIDVVGEYALQDVRVTHELYKFLSAKVDPLLSAKYSSLAYICVDYRKRGVRIDIDRAKEVRDQLEPLIEQKIQEVYRHAGSAMEGFNINSIKELPPVFDFLRIPYPYTDKGNPSITSPWLEKQTHPICEAILNARKYQKIQGDFITKIIDMQAYTAPNQDEKPSRYGRVFPEINIMGARTGRMSCSNPNIQQIPGRDKVLAPMCRSIFVPEEGEKWYSLDYSNQEGRLQVHYAECLACNGGPQLAEEFRKDPNLDMHQRVADMVGIDRGPAKAVNLGVSYGMGIGKLAKSLGVGEVQARHIRDKYNKLAPFLDELNTKCKKAIKDKKCIKTIGGRNSWIDSPVWQDGEQRTFEYKALNKLIQGSAADQIMAAMLLAHKMGIKVLFPVHDQFCISTSEINDVISLRNIMQTAILLSIPSVVDVDMNGGDSWATAGH